jgi:hypothetical protein
VSAIGKWVTRFMGVQWKDIPQEDRNRKLRQHAPDHGRRSFGERITLCGTFGHNSPSVGVLAYVHVIG